MFPPAFECPTIQSSQLQSSKALIHAQEFASSITPKRPLPCDGTEQALLAQSSWTPFSAQHHQQIPSLCQTATDQGYIQSLSSACDVPRPTYHLQQGSAKRRKVQSSSKTASHLHQPSSRHTNAEEMPKYTQYDEKNGSTWSGFATSSSQGLVQIPKKMIEIVCGGCAPMCELDGGKAISVSIFPPAPTPFPFASHQKYPVNCLEHASNMSRHKGYLPLANSTSGLIEVNEPYMAQQPLALEIDTIGHAGTLPSLDINPPPSTYVNEGFLPAMPPLPQASQMQILSQMGMQDALPPSPTSSFPYYADVEGQILPPTPPLSETSQMPALPRLFLQNDLPRSPLSPSLSHQSDTLCRLDDGLDDFSVITQNGSIDEALRQLERQAVGPSAHAISGMVEPPAPAGYRSGPGMIVSPSLDVGPFGPQNWDPSHCAMSFEIPLPRGGKRGPFRDPRLREETAETRKIGSCVRCRMQRIRVSTFFCHARLSGDTSSRVSDCDPMFLKFKTAVDAHTRATDM